MPPDLRKTAICPEWKRGDCPLRPEECKYAHGLEELRATDSFRWTTPCKFYFRGKGCPLGQLCRHPHSTQEMELGLQRAEDAAAERYRSKAQSSTYASRAGAPPEACQASAWPSQQLEAAARYWTGPSEPGPAHQLDEIPAHAQLWQQASLAPGPAQYPSSGTRSGGARVPGANYPEAALLPDRLQSQQPWQWPFAPRRNRESEERYSQGVFHL